MPYVAALTGTASTGGLVAVEKLEIHHRATQIRREKGRICYRSHGDPIVGQCNYQLQSILLMSQASDQALWLRKVSKSGALCGILQGSRASDQALMLRTSSKSDVQVDSLGEEPQR